MSAHWHLEMFNGPRLQGGAATEVLTRFRTHKTAALLCYLALRRHPQPREVLCGHFWPEAAPEAARNSLSAALSSLRRQLEADNQSVLLADRDNVGLQPGAISTDVAAFEAELSAANGAEPLEHLARAVTLYTGPLLPGFYEDWAQDEARRLEESYRAALSRLLTGYEDAGAWDKLAAAAAQGLRLHPATEAWHLARMRALAASGEVEAALRQYETLQGALRRIGEVLSDDARQLARQLRRLPTRPAPANRPLLPPEAHTATATLANGAPESEDEPDTLTKRPQSNLPASFTRFFGREEELAELAELLDAGHSRLFTVSGPSGAGKTRFALEAGRSLRERYQDAVWFVPLADVREAALLPDAIRDTLKLPNVPRVTPREQLHEVLAAQPALLILDNFEQLAETGRAFVQEMLVTVPALSIVITSRQRLNLVGERELALPPLPVPDEVTPVDEMDRFAGAALFCDRARATRADFKLDAQNAAAVAALCRRLDGIPLALELAAARSLLFSPSQILERLNNHLESDFLATRQADVPERHRTLRAAIAWSYELLPPDMQRFFAALSVFHGGCTVEAAEAVCQDPQAVENLARLVESSLAIAEDRNATVRFRLLETLREFAAAQLKEEDEIGLRESHLKYYSGLAERAHSSGELFRWVPRLESEEDNLRAALSHAFARDEAGIYGGGRALRLGGALAGYWEIRARFIEGLAALSRGLTLDVLHPEPDMTREGQLSRARALAGAGHLAWRASDYLLAHSFLNRGLDLFERLKDPWGLAYTLECLGRLSLVQGDPERCLRYTTRGLEFSRQLRDCQRITGCLVSLSWLQLNTGEYENVLETLREVLNLANQIEDVPHRTLALNFMGYASYLMDDLDGAAIYLEESVPQARAANLSWEYGMATAMRGNVRRRRDDFAGARADLREGLKTLHRIGAGWEVAILLDYFGYLEIEEFDWERGAMLMGAAEGLRRSLNQPLQPSVSADNEHFMARLMNSLDEQTFQMAHRRGLHLPLERAVALALEKS